MFLFGGMGVMVTAPTVSLTQALTDRKGRPNGGRTLGLILTRS